ncbi:cyclase family protein [Corynebacterium sp. ES2775-CONJ]|uniref:cyclase family protein n=1 Tax=Corynebacterium sp. ES2775-CONJ TaxID=2974029 RepID=UPI002169D9F9|nr:cyclase family protein [Corynebacterium sp. ES2775-CONJ]MCS4490377.1 cyclase family protein [Corynebacterium sp. ES2775-CONJ]
MNQDLWELYAQLRCAHLVDLTHTFYPTQPHFPGDPVEERTEITNIADSGYAVTQYRLVGQWGTHIDAPAHFLQSGRTVDRIDTDDMISPLVVLDCHRDVQTNPDFQLDKKALVSWEATYGPIPENSFVAFRSDWSKRWPDQHALLGLDNHGHRHSPGWTVDAINFLVQHRGIRAIGHETFDTDPGFLVDRGEMPAQYAILAHDRWQIELLTNLDKLPARGGLLWASWPKPLGGTGFPARAIALIS